MTKIMKKWTIAEEEFLRNNFATTSMPDMIDVLQRSKASIQLKANKMKLNKDINFVKQQAKDNYKKNYGLISKTQFQKGCKPWNKNLKGVQLNTGRTHFKKNHTINAVPVGTESLRVNGDKHYLYIKTEKGWVLKASLALKKLDDGLVISYKDGDSMNVDRINLEVIDRKELMRRNSIHNLPKPLVKLIRLSSQFSKIVEEYAEKHS